MSFSSFFSLLNIVLLLASFLLQASYAIPAQAQPFPSTGCRFGMNVGGPIYTELGYTDVFLESWWSANVVPFTANNYPTAGWIYGHIASMYFCLTGDNPGTDLIFNFYGEGIFTVSGIATPFQYPAGNTQPVPNSLSVLPPNYPGNPTSVGITVPPNTPANPNSVPPTPANPFSIPLVIPANSPANTLNVVVTRCQFAFTIPPQPTGGYNLGGDMPLSWISLDNINPQQVPGEDMNNFHLIRPGYRPWQSSDSFYPISNTSYPIFTKEFLSSFSPFCALRFMVWMGTEGTTGLSLGPNGLVNSGPFTWADRPPCNGCTFFGCGLSCYENMIALANATGCDMWVNVPLQASDDWKVGFANLIANDPVYKLNPWLHVYYEHCNELWNWDFYAPWQWVDNCALADFPSQEQTLGAWFCHGMEMGKLLMSDVDVMQPIFNQVSADFGRPILAGQMANAQSYCGGGLYYIQNNYGTPSNYIYGIAGAPYFATVDPSEITGTLQPMMNAHMQLISQYGGGLKMCAYEAGQGLPSSPESVYETNEALQTSQAMVAQHYAFANMWKTSGGDLCEMFHNTGVDSQWGFWGDLPLGSLINDLSNPVCTKYNTIAGFNNLYGCNCGNAEPPPPPPPSSPPPTPPSPSSPSPSSPSPPPSSPSPSPPPSSPSPSSNVRSAVSAPITSSSSSQPSNPTSSHSDLINMGNGFYWSPRFGRYSTGPQDGPHH